MKKSVPPADPTAYLASLSGWQGRYVQALRAAVIAAAPQLEEVIKWGHLVYFSNGPVLLLRAEPQRVLFGFWRGQRLQRIEPRLTRAVVSRLVTEAITLNSALGNPTGLPASRSAGAD
jgi:hypothetical protein